MMKQNHAELLALGILTFTGLTLSTPKAEAAILWDYSPDTTGTISGVSAFANQSAGQNFAEIVSFADSCGFNRYGYL